MILVKILFVLFSVAVGLTFLLAFLKFALWVWK